MMILIKRTFVIFILSVLIAVLSGCKNPMAESPKPVEIGLIPESPGRRVSLEYRKGAEKAAKETGAVIVSPATFGKHPVKRQQNMIDQLVTQGVGAIIIAPVDSKQLFPQLERARKQGVEIVNISNPFDHYSARKSGFRYIPFIGIDNEAAAYQAAESLASQLPSPGKGAVLMGNADNQAEVKRKNGAVKALLKNRKIDFAGLFTANSSSESAKQTATKILRKHPDIKAIYCTDDVLALGVVQTLKNYPEKNVLVGGFGNYPEIHPLLNNGSMAVTVDSQASRQAYLAVKAAKKLIDFQKVPKKQLLKFKIVTSGNK